MQEQPPSNLKTFFAISAIVLSISWAVNNSPGDEDIQNSLSEDDKVVSEGIRVKEKNERPHYNKNEINQLREAQTQHGWSNVEVDLDSNLESHNTYEHLDEQHNNHFDWTLPTMPEQEQLYCLERSLGEVDQEYFELFLAYYDGRYHKVSKGFTKDLTLALKWIYLTYESWFGKSFLQKAKIKIIIAASEAHYLTLLEEIDKGDKVETAGAYFADYNLAFVKGSQNNQRTLQVAIHEAVHAINYALFGFTSRWLNEGLAEYFENYIDLDPSSLALTSTSWKNKSHGADSPAELSNLVYSHSEWLADIQSVSFLYASSWSYISYFIANPSRRQVLADILSIESSSPCSIQSPDSTLRIIEENLPDFYYNFNDWFYSQVES